MRQSHQFLIVASTTDRTRAASRTARTSMRRLRDRQGIDVEEARSATVLALQASRQGLVGQRIRTKLEMQNFARGALSAFHVERSACGVRGPETFAFPPSVRIVDTSVEPLG